MVDILSYAVDIATFISVIILYEKTNVTLKQYQKDELYKIIDDKILEFMMTEKFEKALEKTTVAQKIDDMNNKLNQLIIAICLTSRDLKDSPICKKNNGG
jgi:c-di-AMP phosphodiesterase-like protein